MRLRSYMVKDDTGLAPNPFHCYCTVAVCTPNHMNATLDEGDWLIGNSSKIDCHRLVYAMRILKKLSMDEYFRDERFEAKKPKPHGTLIEQCGDNIYYTDQKKQWARLPSPFHNSEKAFKQDVRYHCVFVSNHFTTSETSGWSSLLI